MADGCLTDISRHADHLVHYSKPRFCAVIEAWWPVIGTADLMCGTGPPPGANSHAFRPNNVRFEDVVGLAWIQLFENVIQCVADVVVRST
jgi:hypothetical protein